MNELTPGMVALYQIRESVEVYATIKAYDKADCLFYIEYRYMGLKFWQWVTDRVLR